MSNKTISSNLPGRVVLVLQGSGALGAYQVGLYGSISRSRAWHD